LHPLVLKQVDFAAIDTPLNPLPLVTLTSHFVFRIHVFEQGVWSVWKMVGITLCYNVHLTVHRRLFFPVYAPVIEVLD